MSRLESRAAYDGPAGSFGACGSPARPAVVGLMPAGTTTAAPHFGQVVCLLVARLSGAFSLAPQELHGITGMPHLSVETKKGSAEPRHCPPVTPTKAQTKNSPWPALPYRERRQAAASLFQEPLPAQVGRLHRGSRSPDALASVRVVRGLT